MRVLFDGSNGASDVELWDMQLAPGQVLRNENPLLLLCGNGCEDGRIELTREMAIALKDALTEWLGEA